MRIIFFTLIVFVFSLPSHASDELIEKSRKAISELQNNLKAELQKAMKNGGPKNAINICNIKAPEIASNISIEEGVEINRVALKYRNPNNIPDEWERLVIEEFITRANSGENINSLESIKNEGEYFRYMKAIPMGSVCSTCHGTNISKSLQGDILKLYPEDKAIGFNHGDIRGAFSVKIKN